MTPDLERAAEAIYALAPVGVRSWRDAPTDTRTKCLAQARAVLLAIREPSDEVASLQVEELTGNNHYCRVVNGQRRFRAMIDAILGEAK